MREEAGHGQRAQGCRARRPANEQQASLQRHRVVRGKARLPGAIPQGGTADDRYFDVDRPRALQRIQESGCDRCREGGSSSRRFPGTESPCSIGTILSSARSASSPSLRSIGCTVSECVIVLDDADLPLGSVRWRAGGSDGGHQGMRSVIGEFRTERVRRVRVGIRPPTNTLPAKDFDRHEEDVLAQAMRTLTNAIVQATSYLASNRPQCESASALPSQ